MTEEEKAKWHADREQAAYDQLAQETVDLVAHMLAYRWPKGRIFKTCYEILKTDNFRVVTGIVSKAKAQLRELANKPRVDARAEALAFYEHLIADDDVDPRTKIVAQERLDKLLGLESKHDGAADAEDTAAAVRKALTALEAAYATSQGSEPTTGSASSA